MNMTVKLFVKDWMKKRDIENAYALVQKVDLSKVGEATIYRIVRNGGEVESVRADTLHALAKAFACTIAELFAKPPKGKL
jgi:DNA-binding Xre family transcriptional regulator